MIVWGDSTINDHHALFDEGFKARVSCFYVCPYCNHFNPHHCLSSKSSASTHEYSESNRANKLVMLPSNFRDEHRGLSLVSEAGYHPRLVPVSSTVLHSSLIFSLQSENVSRDTEKLIDDVGAALLSKMVVDQDPHRVDTKSMYMELNRLSPRSLETNTNFTDDNEAGFKFPLSAITDEKTSDALFIDSVVS